MPVEGDVLLGKYRVERELGRGGMGAVVAARHIELDERVAIKFVLPEHAQNAAFIQRFIREARASARIKSEHVARVSDVGRLAGGEPYMVMEYLEGRDLEQVLTERGPLPISDAVDYVLQGLEAIAEAHSLQIVHRDLKPANMFLTRRADGSACVKILDFGISKVTGETVIGGSMTKTSQGMLGSPLYMSPEQLQSAKDVDARTDIWSLGVILFQLLTGEYPFDAESLGQLVAAIFQAQPTPMRSLRPEVPEALEGAVLRCLAKSVDQRYASVAELAAALAPFASRLGRHSAERVAGVSVHSGVEVAAAAPVQREVVETTPSPARQTEANWGGTASGAPPKRGARTAAIAVGVTLVLAGVFGTAVMLHKSPAASTVESSPGSAMAAAPKETPQAVVATAEQVTKAVDVPAVPGASASTIASAIASPTTLAGANTAKTSTAPTTSPKSPKGPAKPTVSAAPVPVAAPKSVNCSPPYYFDQDGIKHHKQGCG